ncbi:MAG: type II toxin-antitoxin system prevent-host-death family antitoxin [Dermatophilaceae bacterium]
MALVKVQHAKTHLSALIAAVERGEEVIIARGSTPVARLVPLGPTVERELGFVAYAVPEDFFEPLPAEEIDAWEGRE